LAGYSDAQLGTHRIDTPGYAWVRTALDHALAGIADRAVHQAAGAGLSRSQILALFDHLDATIDHAAPAGEVKVRTRTGREVSDSLPALVGLVDHPAILDGELIASLTAARTCSPSPPHGAHQPSRPLGGHPSPTTAGAPAAVRTPEAGRSCQDISENDVGIAASLASVYCVRLRRRHSDIG
jgi:hypothetical protein